MSFGYDCYLFAKSLGSTRMCAELTFCQHIATFTLQSDFTKTPTSLRLPDKKNDFAKGKNAFPMLFVWVFLAKAMLLGCNSIAFTMRKRRFYNAKTMVLHRKNGAFVSFFLSLKITTPEYQQLTKIARIAYLKPLLRFMTNMRFSRSIIFSICKL